MLHHNFQLSGTTLEAHPSGVLWIPQTRTLCVSDLHLGKSDRIARRRGTLLPPYETRDTLARLHAEINRLAPQTVICLGDSFDDLEALDALAPADHATLATMQAGRDWVWIEGNHDPGPVALGGAHKNAFAQGRLVFRHIADGDAGEVSGHYHPKHTIPRTQHTRACFLYDKRLLIMPSFGTYTGGLRSDHPDLRKLFPTGAIAVLTGQKALPVPL